MRIEVRVSVEADGLVGRDVESASHLGAWASFDPYREAQRVPLVAASSSATRFEMVDGAVLGPYMLDTAETPLRGDESLWIKLYTKTRFADVPSIDKEEHDYVERTQQSGSVQMPFARLLAAVDPRTGTGHVSGEDLMDVNLVATEIIKERVKGRTPNLARVFEAAHKGRVTFTVRVIDMNTAHLQEATATLVKAQTTGGITLAESTAVRMDAYAASANIVAGRMFPIAASMETTRALAQAAHVAAQFGANTAAVAARLPAPARNPITGKLLYVPANFRYFVSALDRFIEIYARQYIGVINPATGEITGRPKYDTKVKSLEGLHFAVYRAMVGMLPVIAFWTHAAAQRPYGTEAEREAALQLYGSAGATEAFYDTSLRAALRRYGMTETSFVAAIAAQYARTDAVVLPEYTLAKTAIVDTGAFVANAAYYTNDSRYRNPHRRITDEERAAAQKDADALLAERHRHGEALDMKAASANLDAAVSLESFDIDVMMFMSKSSDCEDDGNIATSVLRLIAFGRSDRDGTWESAPLRAAQRVLRDHVLFDTGGDVTAAFLGSDGNEMKKGDIKELPLRGSAEDTRNKTGGHAFALCTALARAAVWATRGGFHDTPLHARVRAMPPWQARQPTLVIEGTGPIDHLVLPAGEMFGEAHALTRKAEAARRLVRDVLSTDAWKPFTETFRAYSTPFYARAVEPERRISGFYRNAVHAGAAELYALHPGMSQVAFVNPVTMERGIDTIDILRDSLRDTADTGTAIVALDLPFYAHSVAWQRDMEPVMEAMINQMPVTALSNIARQHVLRPLRFSIMAEKELAEYLHGAGTVLDALALASKSVLDCNACNATYSANDSIANGRRRRRKKRKSVVRTVVVPEPTIVHVHRVLAPEPVVLLPPEPIEPVVVVRSAAGHAFARVGTIHEEMLAPSAVSTITELSVSAHSVFGAQWADALRAAAGRSLVGTLAWDRVFMAMQASAAQPPPIAVAGATDPLGVHAVAVDFDATTPFDAARAHELVAASNVIGWAALLGRETWTRTQGSARTYRVTGACFVPGKGAVPGQLHIDLVPDAARPTGSSDENARRMTLLHVYVMGRVYALHPIVLRAGGVMLHAPAQRESLVHVSYNSAAGGAAHVKVNIGKVPHFAQAFCMKEMLVAEPWITLADMTAAAAMAMMTSTLTAPALLTFDIGAPETQATLAPFVDCHSREDAVLVRFVGRDWAVKKNWAAAIAGIQRLYAIGAILAHEFVVATPLPQSDAVVELHLLVRA